MKHMNNENRKHTKLNKIISIIAVAAVFTMVGTGIGASSIRSNALAESENAPAVEDADRSYESPAISVYEKCADSVVGVTTYVQRWVRSTGEVEKSPLDEGSGVVISDDGYILTNNHVIEKGSYFDVLLPNGETAEAKLIGADSGTDIAVLKVENQTLKAIEIGSSSELKIGETVIAIGNPGGSMFANSVTQGIVSALERNVNRAFTRTVNTIQHDAAINPGNSGGALLNSRGQLVGINTLKYTGSPYSSTTYEGLGFAIPIDTAMPLAQQIIEFGEVRRPALGITCGTFAGPDEPIESYPPASVVISDVVKDGPADEAGIEALDFITSVDGQRIKSLNDLTAILDSHKEGDKIKVTVLRYDDTKTIVALLNSLNYGSSFGSSSIFGDYSPVNGRLNYREMSFDLTLKVIENSEDK